MRLLILADSLSLPSDELNYDDTWPHFLKQEYPQFEIVERNFRESSARRLSWDGPGGNGKDALEYFSPNVVITQFGITDAAPRLLKRTGILARILNKAPHSISKVVYDFLRKHRGRLPRFSDLTPEEFYTHFNNYCKRANSQGVKVFITEICPGTNSVLKVSPKFNECVDCFNRQLHRVAQQNPNATIIPAISVNQEEPSDFQSDGYHHSATGQRKQYRLIVDALRREGVIPDSSNKGL